MASTTKIAEEHGKLSAISIFNDMLNVEYQGKNFSWRTFPDEFMEVMASTLYTNYKEIPNNLKELEEISKQHFGRECKKLMTEFTIVHGELPVRRK